MLWGTAPGPHDCRPVLPPGLLLPTLSLASCPLGHAMQQLGGGGSKESRPQADGAAQEALAAFFKSLGFAGVSFVSPTDEGGSTTVPLAAHSTVRHRPSST